MRTTLFSGLLLSLSLSGPAFADLFLVSTSDGPGFAGPDDVVEVLEKGILPTFKALLEDKRVVTGGLPVGSRKFYLVVEAGTHDEVDRMLRGLPAWGVFSWKVMPLQSLAARNKLEKEILNLLQ